MSRILRSATTLVLAGLAALSGACVRSAGPGSSAAPAVAAAPAAQPPGAGKLPAGPTFDATVRPILEARCAPCHSPGGKMYERLPFDRPDVISSHARGVRRRLKGADLDALEKWLATLPASPPAGAAPES